MSCGVILLLLCLVVSSQCTDIREYCHMETFWANCSKGEVILMKHAMYGRMRLGRCLTTDYEVGCEVDVLTQLDRKCTGRQNCTVKVPDTDLFSVQTCRSDLLAYLEASYVCVRALDLTESTCPRGRLSVHRNEGYLVYNPHSSPPEVCTVSVHVKRGQQVNLTLYELSRSNRTVQFQPSDRCSSYVTVGERNAKRPLQICSSSENTRQVAVYTSASHQLNITVGSTQIPKPQLMLHFKATGCPDVTPPPMAYAKRDNERLEVTCNETNEKWHLVCKDNNWVGRYGNCSKGKVRGGSYKTIPEGKKHRPGKKEDLPIGLLIAITLGVLLGVFAGFIFLLIGFFCRKTILQNQHQTRSGLLGNHDVHGNTYKMVDVDIPHGEEPCYMCHHENSIYTKSALDVPQHTAGCRLSGFTCANSPYVMSRMIPCSRECKQSIADTEDYERPVRNVDHEVGSKLIDDAQRHELAGNQTKRDDVAMREQQNMCLPASINSVKAHRGRSGYSPQHYIGVSEHANNKTNAEETLAPNMARDASDNGEGNSNTTGFKTSEINSLEEKINNFGHKTMMEKFPLPNVSVNNSNSYS